MEQQPHRRIAQLEHLAQQRYNEIKRLRRAQGLVEQEKADLERTLNLIRSIRDAQPRVPRWRTAPRSRRSKVHRATPTLFISDLHADEVVNPAEIEWYNAYNRELATARLRQTVRGAVDLVRNYVAGVSFDGIVVPLGGDILTGDIHDELARTNESTVAESIIYWAPQLVAAIEALHEEFGNVYVPCVVGNHDRWPTNRRPPAKRRAIDSLSWIIYGWIADRFRDHPQIQVQVAEGADVRYTVYGTRFLLTHGDQFKGGNGIAGIWSPLIRGVVKKHQRQAALGNPFDWLIMGHWHQLVWGQGFIVNGSIKGYDEYAYVNNFTPEPPQQALWITTPERGITMQTAVFAGKDETWRTGKK